MQEKPLRVVIVGADAAGMSAASQIKRRIKTAEVIVLEKTEDVSYGACGMPYNIGFRRDINDLVVMRAQDFKEKRGIDVRLLSKAIGVDVTNNKVVAKNLASDREYEVSYDKLFVATGAKAILLKIDSINQEGIFTLKILEDARKIKNYIEKNKPQKAVLIGGGFINLELAENFKRLDIDVIILEKMNDIMLAYEEELRQTVKDELKRQGVNLVSDIDIQKIDEKLKVYTNKGEFEADIINVATGIKPNTEFLDNSEIKMEHGAVVVDRFFKTNIDNIYSGGDCSLIYNRLLGRNVYLPLGTNANKAGKIAGANMAGANEQFAGVVGTSAFKCFDLSIGKTGLSLKEAEKEGFNAFKTIITAPTKAHGYPIQGKISVIIVAEKSTGRLLGAQAIGDESAALRTDVMATALYSKMTIKDIQGLDLVYSPPFAPVWDPILVCANQAIKQV